jgi:hypothetical protein
MNKYIVWFLPATNKITYRQFHTEAENEIKSIENLKNTASFFVKIVSVSAFTDDSKPFINNKFY